MSRFNEKRIADEMVSRLSQAGSERQRRDGLIILLTFSSGLFFNFWLSKIEIASIFWFATLWALVDLCLSFGRLKRIGGIKRVLLGFLFASVLTMISVQLFIAASYCEQHAALLSGVLHTPSDGKDHSKEPPSIELTGPGPRFGSLNLPHDRFSLRRKGNEILLSTTLRDKDQRLIVEITDNHWRVAASNQQCWDKNYTSNALEVKDGQGRVVLQLWYRPDTIRFQAEYADLGWRFADPRLFDQISGIRPAFQYPSSEHWGEFDPKSGYSPAYATSFLYSTLSELISRSMVSRNR